MGPEAPGHADAAGLVTIFWFRKLLTHGDIKIIILIDMSLTLHNNAE